MKKLLFILPIIILPFITGFFVKRGQYLVSTKYYVDATGGSDAAAGTSPGTAWQTIAKVNSFGNSFIDGDSLLLKCGETFTGGIVFTRSVRMAYYSTGAKPIITGLSTISSWVNLGGNIWEAPTTGVKTMNNLVLRNGTPQQVGRYPNASAASEGYLTNTATSNTTLTGPALSTVTDWTGAEVAIREKRWLIEHKIITAHSGGTLTFSTAATTPLVGFGYFFQRDSRTLDVDGEWWQDGTNNKLRMYFGNNNPGAYTIQAATTDTLLTGPNNVSVDGINFQGSGKNAINFNGRTGITIINCTLYNSGEENIYLNSCKVVNISNNTIINSLGSGIEVFCTGLLTTNVGILVQNNIIRNVAYIAGMEKSAKDCPGIRIYGGNTLSAYNNTISNCGYTGIWWAGDTINVKYNFIDSVCTKRDDGGGIYTWVTSSGEPPTVNHDRWVISNIVLHAFGNNNGTNSTTFNTSAQGLYADGASRYINYDSNTVAYANGNGFHGNGNTDNRLRYNTFYNNANSISLQRFSGSNPMRNITITKNIITQYRFQYNNQSINSPSITAEADILAMGTIDSNYYSTKAGIDSSVRKITTFADGSNYKDSIKTVAYMPSVGQETHSTNIATTGVLYYNATNAPVTTSLGSYNYTDSYGTNYPGSVTIPAYASKVLFQGAAIVSGSGLFNLNFKFP